MALRIYGLVDDHSLVEYMIRCRSDALVADTAAILQARLAAAFPLVLANFTGPIRLSENLVASEFEVNGSVNGVKT